MIKKLNKYAGMMMMNAGPFMGGLIIGLIIGIALVWFLLGKGIMVSTFCPVGK